MASVLASPFFLRKSSCWVWGGVVDGRACLLTPGKDGKEKVFSTSWLGVRCFCPSFFLLPQPATRWCWEGGGSEPPFLHHPSIIQSLAYRPLLLPLPSPAFSAHQVLPNHFSKAIQGDLAPGEHEQEGGCILSKFSLVSGRAGAGLGSKPGDGWGNTGEGMGQLCVALSLLIAS